MNQGTPATDVTPAPPGRTVRWLRGLGILAAVALGLAGSATAAWLLRTARTPAAPRPDLLSRGQLLYTANCAACHGYEGRGDGPSAAEMNPPPSDLHLTRAARLPDAFRRVIRAGVPGTAMAANSSLAAAISIASSPTRPSGHVPHGYSPKCGAPAGRIHIAGCAA